MRRAAPLRGEHTDQILAEVATGEPQGRYVDVAGPETQDLVDMARRTHDVLGRNVKLVPTWWFHFQAFNAFAVGTTDLDRYSQRTALARAGCDRWLHVNPNRMPHSG